MQLEICLKCGCDLSYHVSDFLLTGNWKDSCQHTVDGKICACDEFSPTLQELVVYLLNRPSS